MISKGLSDEVFVFRQHSILIKIAELIDAINQGAVAYSVGRLSVGKLKTFVGSGAVREDVLAGLQDRRRDEPLLISFIYGEPWIIDGSHRLEKRGQDGFGFCEVLEFRAKSLKDFVAPLGF